MFPLPYVLSFFVLGGVPKGSNDMMSRSCRPSQDSCPPSWLPVQVSSTSFKHLRPAPSRLKSFPSDLRKQLEIHLLAVLEKKACSSEKYFGTRQLLQPVSAPTTPPSSAASWCCSSYSRRPLSHIKASCYGPLFLQFKTYHCSGLSSISLKLQCALLSGLY
jgi:hypothetical protein